MSRVVKGLSVTRPVTSILIALIVFVPIALVDSSYSDATAVALPFLLFSMAGFTLNDIADSKKDAVSKPWRAIPSGWISIRSAQSLSHFLVFLGIAVVLLRDHSVLQYAFYAIYLALGLAYNPAIEYKASLKTPLAAVGCVVPFVFGLMYLGKMEPASLLVVMMSFVYIVGRELRMDVLDHDGDRVYSSQTIAVLCGKSRTRFIAASCIALSVSGTLLVLVTRLGVPQGLLLAAVLLLMQAWCEVLWSSSNPLAARRSVRLLWGVMLIGVGGAFAL